MQIQILNKDKIFMENQFTFAVYADLPKSKGHCLVVPKKKVSSIFNLDSTEYLSLFQLVKEVKNLLSSRFKPSIFRIIINNKGDNIKICDNAHISIIPKYKK